MLTGIHFLTTYACNFECDHCFLHCGPGAGGTFRLEQFIQLLDEAVRLGTIEKVFFEGGEPFLFYPLVLAGIELARRRSIQSGIVTNAYWATSVGDARLWLAPLHEHGVAAISLSDDSLHYGPGRGTHAERVLAAAKDLGMTASVMCTERPQVQYGPAGPDGAPPTITGGVMFRGRAAECLVDGLPRRPWDSLTRCPHENLKDPGRVHVDCFGHVHLCQGLSMGNCWQTPFSELVRAYNPDAHPVVGPLLRGGPAQLAREYNLPHEEGYVDECHFCYRMRQALRQRFPEYLGPDQVYGVK